MSDFQTLLSGRKTEKKFGKHLALTFLGVVKHTSCLLMLHFAYLEITGRFSIYDFGAMQWLPELVGHKLGSSIMLRRSLDGCTLRPFV